MTSSPCLEFLDRANNDPVVARLMRVVTDVAELPLLGQRLGLSFDTDEIVAAIVEHTDGSARVDAPSPVSATSVLHHEFIIDDLPELAPLIDELPNLRLRPAAVDLDAFDSEFCGADHRWTDESPASPGFRAHYEEIMEPHWTGTGQRRDFHLINLDQAIRADEYRDYCDAKVRTLEHLERVFGPEVRFSGSMWYPPFAYRLWHTNETQPGWRMYLIDFDEEIPSGDARTFMRYMDPQSHRIVTLADRPRLLRFFRIRQEPEHLLWHCIVNGAMRHRWSFGFVIPDDWMDRISLAHTLGSPTHREWRIS